MYSSYGFGLPRYFEGGGFGQASLTGGQGRGGSARNNGSAFQGQGGVGVGMSGMRLLGARGRNRSYVLGENPTHERATEARGGARKGPVPGAGVGNAGSRVRFEEVPVTIAEAGTGGPGS